MNISDVITGQETKDLVKKVVEKVAAAVVATMGPNGRYAVLDHAGNPKTTKDGVSVAKAIKLADRGEDLIAKIMTEASIRTDKECGDGTTTTIFLTREFYNEFREDMDFRTKLRLNQLCDETITRLAEHTEDASVGTYTLNQLALTTSNNDPGIVAQILEIFSTVRGIPEIEYRKGVLDTDTVEYSEGLEFIGGFASPNFTENGTGRAMLIKEPDCVIFNGSVNRVSLDDFRSLAEHIVTQIGENGPKQLVIMARDFDQEFLDRLQTVNIPLGQIPTLVPVRINGAGSAGAGIVADVSVALNGVIDADFNGWKERGFSTFKAKDMVVAMGRFKIFADTEEDRQRIENRVTEIEDQIDQMPMIQKHGATANLMRRRISSLIGGHVTVIVGGETESDIEERKDRFVDVGRAVHSAITNGVLPGMGWSLAKVGKELIAAYPEDPIVSRFASVLGKQLVHLMSRTIDDPKIEYINLATGETGSHPGWVNVWDAKLATVTALRAGLTTAIILASTESLVVGGRSAALQVPQ